MSLNNFWDGDSPFRKKKAVLASHVNLVRMEAFLLYSSVIQLLSKQKREPFFDRTFQMKKEHSLFPMWNTITETRIVIPMIICEEEQCTSVETYA